MMLFVWLALVAFGLAELLVVGVRLLMEASAAADAQRAEWLALDGGTYRVCAHGGCTNLLHDENPCAYCAEHRAGMAIVLMGEDVPETRWLA